MGTDHKSGERHPARYLLPAIIVAQFACVSLWFASNGVMGAIQADFGLADASLGHLTSAVQFGFISGTLVFALLAVSDRFPASVVFLACAVAGALFNVATISETNTFASLVGLRALTGFCLAGIYPVGMKIASDHFPQGLGKALGYLLGALVLGTAFPHFARAVLTGLPWRSVVITTSILAVLGGLLLYLVVGVYRSGHVRGSLHPGAVLVAFRNDKFRAAALGYFGHMWELYAFWAFVPVLVVRYMRPHGLELPVSLLAFAIIGIGALSCILGGYWSLRIGSHRVAIIALLISCACCLLAPVAFLAPMWIFVGFLLVWGMAVIADSPQFSTLVARSAPAHLVGSALTMVNCIGFTITIFSIQLITFLADVSTSNTIWMVLAMGPLLGVMAMAREYLDLRFKI